MYFNLDSTAPLYVIKLFYIHESSFECRWMPNYKQTTQEGY